MKRRHRIGCLAVLSALITCASVPEPTHPAGCERVYGVPGPEDFALDTSSRRGARLLVSSQERRKEDPGGQFLEPGKIFSVSLDGTNHASPMRFVGRDDYPFHPHGVDTAVINGQHLLYVINHALHTNHSVEVFRIQEDELVFMNRLRTDLFISPNDIVVTEDGSIYVTNDHTTTGWIGFVGDFLSLGWSNVVHYDPFSKRWRVAATGIAMANGIEVENDRLFVAGTRDEGINVFRRDPTTGRVGERLHFIGVGSGVDNLIWRDGRTLITAAHPDMFAFLNHYGDQNEHSPSEVYLIDVSTMAVERIYYDDGISIDASSTAMIYGDRLIISQVFDPEILFCPLL